MKRSNLTDLFEKQKIYRKAGGGVITDNDCNEIFKEYPDVVTVDDLQKMLHIGRNNAYGMLKTGRIKTVRVGKKYIIPKQSVIGFLNDDSKKMDNS